MNLLDKKLTAKEKRSMQDDYIKEIKDEEFLKYMESLHIKEEFRIKYLYRLKDAYLEYKNCKTCKNLKECKNSTCGFRLTPYVNEKSITFSYDACKYESKYLNDSKYQENVTMYETPTSLKNASLKSIYTDDKNRVETIKYFKSFMDNYPKKKVKGLYLSGSFGVGKTYMIAALFNEYAKKGIKSVIIYYPEFLRSLKESFQDDYKEKYREVSHAPLLLIDDIGAENITPWSRDEILGPILQYRMEEELPTFFTSNLNLKELEIHLANTGNSVDKIKARRIIERIKEVSEEIVLKSINRRG